MGSNGDASFVGAPCSDGAGGGCRCCSMCMAPSNYSCNGGACGYPAACGNSGCCGAGCGNYSVASGAEYNPACGGCGGGCAGASCGYYEPPDGGGGTGCANGGCCFASGGGCYAPNDGGGSCAQVGGCLSTPSCPNQATRCCTPSGCGCGYPQACGGCADPSYGYCQGCGGGCCAQGNSCCAYSGPPACGCTCNAAGGCCPNLGRNCCQNAGRCTYTAEEWEQYNGTAEGNNQYQWWASWIPTPDGQAWCANKQREARRLVDGMIGQWGLEVLRSGEGVVDVGGDPGFLAAELLRSGIHVTVVDPAWGNAGKSNPATTQYINDPEHWNRVANGATPFRVVRQPFDKTFAEDPANAQLLAGASAVVALYPDEATDYLLYYTASRAMRTAIIPCNECAQYYPPHNPTYEGFVADLLQRDRNYVGLFGQSAVLVREYMSETPFCRVVLQRTPPRIASVPPPMSVNASGDASGCLPPSGSTPQQAAAEEVYEETEDLDAQLSAQARTQRRTKDAASRGGPQPGRRSLVRGAARRSPEAIRNSSKRVQPTAAGNV